MHNPYRILLVEDDPGIRQALVDAFTRREYLVIPAADAKEGLRLATEENYDLALLDIALPGGSGLDILSYINKNRAGTPAIMLTAKGTEDDKVRGLESGADDYIVKPFSIRELIARMEAVLRRSPERPLVQSEIPLPGGVLNVAEHSILKNDGTVIALSSREFDLLHYLASHPGRIISREELLRRVWDLDPKAVETRSIEMTMTRLREKLGPDLSVALYTKRGQGYRWDVPES